MYAWRHGAPHTESLWSIKIMLALFGLFVCIGLGAPWWVFVIGFFCVLLDAA